MNKNTFAATPPMGWNSYDYYDTTVNEAQVKANAKVLAEKLKPYGWEYVVVDIEWYAHGAGSMREQFQYIPFAGVEMDDFSRLLPDPERFPSSVDGQGFKPLADYIHSLGLKFGIHIMRGIPRIAAHHHTKILGSDVTADMVADPSSICRWNPDMYGVRDTPAGQAYYDSIIQLYADWGVDFIKCDDICNTDNWVEHSPRAYERRHEIEMLHKAIAKSGREIVLSLSPGPALIEQAWHYKKYANMWRITDDFWDDWTLSLLTNWAVLDMLTPDCRPEQMYRTEDAAVWTAQNEKTGQRYAALFNLGEREQEICADLAEAFPGIRAGRELWTGEQANVKGQAVSCRLAPHACAAYLLCE